MRVIATAGHVDHGKSTLVRALTGTDPDRLEEEKRRGLTIELGFAGMELPSGQRIAFVDVPGHRRFIGNMLAGIGPAPVVMFVVAADQGWQAQSIEHLEAVDALGISRGLLVLTRCGLADESQIATVRAAALSAMSSTSLRDVQVVETDALAGEGIDQLRDALDELACSLPTVDEDAPVRLWVDRAFTIKGAGTVVTGTLGAGTLRVGDELRAGTTSMTVRSLQVLGADVDEVMPVSRVAVGLRGVAKGDVSRGTSLVTPGAFVESRVLDVRAETGHPWSEASGEVSVHIGTAAVPAHVRPFDERHARLMLDAPIAIHLGDRIIVRDDSASRINCGATVLDIDPVELRRRGAGRARAGALTQWSPGDAMALVTDRGVLTRAWLRSVGAQVPDSLAATLTRDAAADVRGFVVSGQQAGVWADAVAGLVADDARTNKLSRGVPVAALTTQLGIPAELAADVIKLAGLRVEAGRVLSEAHQTSLGEAEASIAKLRERLTRNPFDAPEADDLAALGLGARQLATAAHRGAILRLPADPADIVLLPDAPARAMRVLAGLEQPFSTSQARAALGTTRRIVIPLLEHLDSRGWTRRDGNVRFVVR